MFFRYQSFFFLFREYTGDTRTRRHTHTHSRTETKYERTAFCGVQKKEKWVVIGKDREPIYFFSKF